jgi:hypothetical protein
MQHDGRARFDDGVLEGERRPMFDASWICAGRADDVAEPGTQKVLRVGTTGVRVSPKQLIDDLVRPVGVSEDTWRGRQTAQTPTGFPLTMGDVTNT